MHLFKRLLHSYSLGNGRLREETHFPGNSIVTQVLNSYCIPHCEWAHLITGAHPKIEMSFLLKENYYG